MDNDTQKIIANQIATLPEDVRKAISSVDYASQLQEIVKRNKLLIDQAGKLETETTLTLIGLEPLNDYVTNISRELGIPMQKAIIIAHDADDLIFKNIRDSLRKMNDQVLEEEPGVGVAQPSREDVLEGVENPKNIQAREQSVSVSSLKSNSANPEYPSEKIDTNIEVRRETTPEIPPKAMLPMKSLTELAQNKTDSPLHENTPPVENIVEEKLTNTITSPKETISVTENSKLPTKPPLPPTPAPTKNFDPYREPLN